MNITAKAIADLVGGKLNADPDLVLTGAAGLTEAGPGDISFLANLKYAEHLSLTRAGLVLMPESMPQSEKPSVLVRNPQLAFARLLEILDREMNPRGPAGVHPAAVVSPGALLGAGVTVGPCAVIEDGAAVGDGTVIGAHCFIGKESIIGKNCLFHPRVVIRERIRVGNNVIIQPGASIGGDGFGFAASETGPHKIPQIGTVEIGDDVEIGANTTIDRATTGATRIGRYTKIDNLVQIAHNVQIGEFCIIIACAAIAGSTKIGNGVTIAGQAGVAGHLTVGDRAVIGAQAGVIGDVPAKETVSGYPARPHREAMKIQAIIQRLPELYQELRKARRTEHR